MELTDRQGNDLRRPHRDIRGRKGGRPHQGDADAGRWLLLDGDTVHRHRECYLSGGVDALPSDARKGCTGRPTVARLEVLGAHLSTTVCPRVTRVVEWVAQGFGVCYTPSGTAVLLRRMGPVYKRPVKVPGKANPQAQQEFVRDHQRTKASLGEHDRICFLDGVHPILHNSVAVKGWVKRGRTVHLTTNTDHSRVNINGALQVATGRVVAVQGESVNAQSTLELMQMLL